MVLNWLTISLGISELCKENFADEADMTEEEVEEELAIIRYSKTYLEGPLKNRQNKGINDKW